MPPVQARPIYSILQALDRNFRRTRPQCGCRSNVAVITDASSGWEREADGNIWSRGPDLNRGPADYESAALPTELPRRLLDSNIGAKKLSNFGRVVCGSQERPGSGRASALGRSGLPPRSALAAAARSTRSRIYSARDGIHQPGDAQANQHEQREGPQHISHAARTRALREARERQ